MQLIEVGKSLRSQQCVPPNKLKGVDEIMDSFSSAGDTMLQEVTSVILVAKAGNRFPQHIVQQIIKLPPSKKQSLLDVVSKKSVAVTPYYQWHMHPCTTVAQIQLRF